MSLCDRIAIISKGEFAGIFNEGELTENEIGFMMAGAQAKDRLKMRLYMNKTKKLKKEDLSAPSYRNPMGLFLF